MDHFTAIVLILIYESDITISNESGVASWWSAARTLFATFCPVIARGYYLYQRAKCFQHSQRRNCSYESGIECGCICSSSCLVTQSIECRHPAARWQKQAVDFTSIIVTLDECKDNGCNFFANCQTIADLSQRKNYQPFTIFSGNVWSQSTAISGKGMQDCRGQISPLLFTNLSFYFDNILWMARCAGVWR